MKTPILLLVFNRPSTTRLVFEAIQQAQPEQLFIAADGPRPDRISDAELCRETRSILNNVNWKCKVHTLFRETNIGCRNAVSSAINWFFAQVDEGIILEDDCLPHQTFFPYCEKLLEYYRHDSRIMQICGSNFQFGQHRGDGSYYFSKYSHIWGWASWQRAWQLYDVDMKTFPTFKDQRCIESIFSEPRVQQYWMMNFQKMYEKKIDTWDYQWVYAIWSNNGLSIIPNTNLVSNIGFGEDATHTKSPNTVGSNQLISSMNEIIHPTFVLQNKIADEYSSKRLYTYDGKWITLIKRQQKKIKNFITK